jgi:AcrR family transcriptional regulator
VPPRRRRTLDRATVIEAALALADEAGLEGLSMRKLGQRLGVEAMSLYNHVKNKDDVVSAIVDLVWAQVPPPEPGAPWREAIREHAIGMHQAFLRHPWACGVFPSGFGPPRMLAANGVLGALREAGFSEAAAYHAHHVIDSHLVGYTQQIIGFAPPDLTGPDGAELDPIGYVRAVAGELPYIFEHIELHAREEELGLGSGFEFGLDLILDGLERVLARDL